MIDPALIFADISHHQTAVDLDAYAAGGHRIIAMKATEADVWTDATFTDRWHRAGQLGLVRRAYAFLRTPISGARQFDHLLATVQAAGGLKPGDLLCQDVEDVGYSPDDPTRAARIARAAACSVEFTARALAAGFPVGWTYTGRWYAGPAGLTAALLPPGWRRGWFSDTTPDVIELPAGWTRDQVVAVQYTDHADLPGISGTDASILLEGSSMVLDPDAKTYLDGKFATLAGAIGVTWYGDDRDDAKDTGTHPYNLQAIVKRLDEAATQQKAESAAIAALAGMVSAGVNDLTVEQVTATVKDAVAQALAEGTVSVDVSVHGDPVPPTAAGG